MKIVTELPKKIKFDGKIIFNPTPEACLEHGYRLATEEELADIEQERLNKLQEFEQIEQERLLEIETLRHTYRNITSLICLILEIDNIDKFESFMDILVLSEDIKDLGKVTSLMKLSLALLACDTELKRKDGDDAWERI